MYKKYIALGLLLFIFFLFSGLFNPASADSQNSFQVLIDTNLIHPDEAAQSSRFAADGVWSVTFNSSRYGYIDWPATFKALHAQKWLISEENPGSTRQVDFDSNATGRMSNSAMIYLENHSTNTIATDAQIQKYSSHVVPSFGAVGKRIIILGRTFQSDTYPTVLLFKHALQNPLVSGGVFEFQPNQINKGARFDVGCQFVLSLKKKCYVLLPPGTTSDYLSEIQNMVSFFENKGILNNPNFYIVLAAYNRDFNGNNPIHYVSTGPNDRHSFEAVVKWLNQYRHIKPTPTPIPTPATIPGDLNGDGHVTSADYDLFMPNFGSSGQSGWIPSDIKKDGVVDIFDFNILVGNLGK